MKQGAIIIIGSVALSVAAVLWARESATSATPSAPASAVSQPRHERSSVAFADRIFLTRDQMAQAVTSGTLDRPVKSLLAINAPMHFGDYRWDDKGVPAGPTWIRIDLESQLISVFRAGHEIGTAVIVYGGDNKETPGGTLHVLAKARDHHSSLYDAEMPYTLRLTNDGVSIHASDVRWGAATHGCIGVPWAFAQRLFDAAAVGDEVTVVPASARSSA